MVLGQWISIGELADRTGVAPSALRFYEELGLISSERTAGNQRRFRRATIRRVSVVRAAQRCGIALDEVASVLAELPSDRAATHQDWQRISEAWSARLDDRIATLTRLRDKLTGCIGCGCLSLDRCWLLNPDDEAARSGAGPRFVLP